MPLVHGMLFSMQIIHSGKREAWELVKDTMQVGSIY